MYYNVKSKNIKIFINGIGNKFLDFMTLRSVLEEIYAETSAFLVKYELDPNRFGKATRKVWRMAAKEIYNTQVLGIENFISP